MNETTRPNSRGRSLARSAQTTGSIRHASARRRHRHVVVLALLSALLFLTSGAVWAYHDLDSNIRSHDIEDLLGTDRPDPQPDSTATRVPDDPAAGRPLNVVLIGTDDRSGDNEAIGGITTPGIRSDTVIVAHISAGRDRIDLVSIPRDSWVVVPECELPDGTRTQPREGKFNAAFQLGGSTGDVGYAAACTIRTIEALTCVRIDGFIAVDFVGFVRVVDALGGVPFCVPEPIDDPSADLRLDAGYQVLDGHQALGYARARKTLADGSDVRRIERQQDLLAATIRHAMNQNLLTDAGRMYGFLDAATSAVDASDQFSSISSLAGLANSLRRIDPENISFHTVPWVHRGDGANVLWTAEAEHLWANVAADRPIVTEEPQAPPDAPDTGSGQDRDPGDTTGPPSQNPTAPGSTLDESIAEEDEVCG